jgi:hypothetical protein
MSKSRYRGGANMSARDVVKIDTCGVPTPHMGPWVRIGAAKNKPRYALPNCCSIPDAELIRLHVQEKKNATELAKLTGETPRFMRAKLRSKSMKRCFRKNFRSKRRDIDMQELLIRYEIGYSTREIASFFKVGKNTIMRRLRSAGRRLDYKTPVAYARAKIAHGQRTAVEMKKFGLRTKMKKADGGLFDW